MASGLGSARSSAPGQTLCRRCGAVAGALLRDHLLHVLVHSQHLQVLKDGLADVRAVQGRRQVRLDLRDENDVHIVAGQHEAAGADQTASCSSPRPASPPARCRAEAASRPWATVYAAGGHAVLRICSSAVMGKRATLPTTVSVGGERVRHHRIRRYVLHPHHVLGDAGARSDVLGGHHHGLGLARGRRLLRRRRTGSGRRRPAPRSVDPRRGPALGPPCFPCPPERLAYPIPPIPVYSPGRAKAAPPMRAGRARP